MHGSKKSKGHFFIRVKHQTILTSGIFIWSVKQPRGLLISFSRLVLMKLVTGALEEATVRQ